MDSIADKILSLPELLKKTSIWKAGHKKIVFTNGCFDILHLGHIYYLEKARKMGDKLIVGLNTDRSVTHLKGRGRPFVKQDARVKVLAALSFVDAVVLFDEDTPFELIRNILPDILVKGNDYLAENIVGTNIVKESGGKVATIRMVEGYSTTAIVEKILETKRDK